MKIDTTFYAISINSHSNGIMWPFRPKSRPPLLNYLTAIEQSEVIVLINIDRKDFSTTVS